ncbi:SDR family oxidoreductase [Tellurirhabdus bombi]|uniref:SDR family oxidoreductase n=1 Tax=Tellurirhabdus bombi TaxID=2907205 RepID=UPI001F171969|nr:SDR family oxidoreductase [Tellurirhabdus bombi]
MQNKIVLVTGANSGMGMATSVELARKGAEVVMLCRNEERGQEALRTARTQSGSDRIALMQCDLASLASIRAVAEKINARYPVVDVLINNAGVVNLKRQTTADGFEMMLGVNHLGHFLLTNLLLEALQKGSQGRIVNVSSDAHKVGKIHFEDPHLSHSFNVVKGYAQSKLANILFTRELAKRVAGSRVTVNSVHPGAVTTNLGISRETGFGKWVYSLLKPFFLTPAEGAKTAVYLASSPEVGQFSGRYFYKMKIATPSKKAQDDGLARRLWEWSEKEVGL